MQRPMVWLTTALAAGIGASAWLRPHPILATGLFLFAMVGWLWFSRGGKPALGFLLLAAAAAGGLRYSMVRYLGPGPLGAWVDRPVELVGTLRQVRVDGGLWRGYLWVEAVRRQGQSTWQPVTGKVWLRHWTSRSPRESEQQGPASSPGGGAAGPEGRLLPREGERVAVKGFLTLPPRADWPGQYDQGEYLANRGVFLMADLTEPPRPLGSGRIPWVVAAANGLRSHLVGVLEAALPPDKAALLAGLILGVREGIPQAWEEAFRSTGVLHVLAASGANVAFVVLPCRRAVQRLGAGRRLSALLAIGIAWVYALLAGADPPVTRAALMASLYYLGEAQSRRVNGLHTLAVSAFLLLSASPGLLFDLGFQLSFAATLSILLYGRRLVAALGRWLPQPVAEALGVTLAAAAAVEPLLLYRFGFASLISPIANLYVALLVEAAVLLGSLGLILALIQPLLGAPLLGLVSLLLTATVHPVLWWSHAPGAYMDLGTIPLAAVVAWYGILLALHGRESLRRLWAGRMGLRRHFRLRAPMPPRTVMTGVAATLIAALGLWAGRWAAASTGPAPPRLLEAHFVDVGQGDAAILRFPNGRVLVVDGGDAGEVAGIPYDAGRDRLMPVLRQLGVRHIDWMVLTHPHQDHVGGLPALLRGFSVGQIWEPGSQGEAPGYADLIRTARRQGVTVRRVGTGWTIRPAPEAVIQVLNPGAFSGADVNSRSVVLSVQYRSQTFLLTGDIGRWTEGALVAAELPVQATVLKVGHHGSATSTSRPFLLAVQPQVAVISVGNNRFGHPAPVVLNRLHRAGARVYRTDRYGTISLFTDGDSLAVATARRPWYDRGHRLVGAW